jgi:hypothetical protein
MVVNVCVVILPVQLQALNEVLLKKTAPQGEGGVMGGPRSLKERAEKEVRALHVYIHSYP